MRSSGRMPWHSPLSVVRRYAAVRCSYGAPLRITADFASCARAPKTWNKNSPCGVVVSICSVNERNAIPRALSSFTVANRCGSDRPSRSSFHTTRQSPDRRNARALVRPTRSPLLPLA
jgi:hypothetical protein